MVMDLHLLHGGDVDDGAKERLGKGKRTSFYTFKMMDRPNTQWHIMAWHIQHYKTAAYKTSS